MQKKTSALVISSALVLSLLPMASHAESNYVKLGVGQSRYWDDISATQSGYYIAYGIPLDSSMDVEFGYIHFGRKTFNVTLEDIGGTTSSSTQSIYAAGVGKIPVSPKVNLLGKLGLAVNRNSKVDASSNLLDQDYPDPPGRSTNLRALIGTGLSMQFNKNISGAIEYTYFGNPAHGAKLSLFNAAVMYHF